MASSSRTDNKRRIDALEVKKLQDDQQTVRRRLDKVENSAQLVVENSTNVEELYKTATDARNFRNLASESGKALLHELSTQCKLPWPLPENTPEDWQNISEETRVHEVEVVRRWWKMAAILPDAIQFVFPNKARADKEPNTRNWTRKPGHFILKLRFGIAAMTIQEALQGKIGSSLSKAHKHAREQGLDIGTNLFVNRAMEEMERKRQKTDKGKAKGKGAKGRGKAHGMDGGAQ